VTGPEGADGVTPPGATAPGERPPGRTTDRPMHEWMRWEPTRNRGWLSSYVLTPARIVVGVGAALGVVGGVLPWAEGRVPGLTAFDRVFFSGLAGAGDGLVIVIVCASAGLLTLHHTPALSRVRTVRLAPAILVVVAAMTWVNGYRAMQVVIEGWHRRGGSGGVAPGLWMVGIGIILMTIGTIPLLPAVVRWQRAADDPADLVTIRPRDVAVVAGSIGGVVVGAAAGIALGLALTGPHLVGTLAFGAMFGGVFGAYGGAWAVRAALDAWADWRR
jgi:hypothetical protein